MNTRSSAIRPWPSALVAVSLCASSALAQVPAVAPPPFAPKAPSATGATAAHGAPGTTNATSKVFAGGASALSSGSASSIAPSSTALPPPPSALLVPGSDSCASPDVLFGLGTFAFDTTGASTGLQGQNETICALSPQTSITNDVWFTWQAPHSGTVKIATCSLTTLDTKIAVYAGTACPTGTALACNDDACFPSPQSAIQFAAAGGASYVIQIGRHPGGPPPQSGSGQFTITYAVVPANDDCASPAAIAGTGVFAYDTTLATTGVQGQSESLCRAYFSTSIDKDLWFAWQAPFTGRVDIDTCGTTLDTKFAVYAGSACPLAGTAVACNDDFCSNQSRVLLDVTLGAAYLIQIGQHTSGPGGPGAFHIVPVFSPSNDDCAASAPIFGPGPHAFDNTAATTGTEGQSNLECLAFGYRSIANDVWFTWTAAATSQHEFSVCGSQLDTKVAIYAGGGCPSSAAIACNDDNCSLASRVCFPAVQGQSYTIQLGTFPGIGGVPGGVGTFTITPRPPAAGNDDCSGALALGSGIGPFAYDSTNATTGCEGQTNANCSAFGSTAIARDLWFTWTAPAGGGWQISTCGIAGSVDTKIAVYDGAGCPAAHAIACNDDACGFQSETCFSAVAGHAYTFQIGSYPGAAGGSSSFRLLPIAMPTGCVYDDGTSENSVGYAALPMGMCWLQRFGAIGETSIVRDIRAAYGTPGPFSFSPPNGTPAIVAIWDDPNDDGDPIDAVLLQQVATSVQNVDTDVFTTIPLPAPQVVHGVFFVGVAVATGQGEYIAPLDESSCPSNSNGRAWILGNSSGTVDLSDLTANDLGLDELDHNGLPGVWLLRAQCDVSAGTAFCAGDGTGQPCPCGNSGAPGHGCANSVQAAGALVQAIGVPRVSSDSITLLGSGMPNSAACLFLQGTARASVVFGDGLRCVAGSIVRLGTKISVGGIAQMGYGIGTDTPISVRGLIPAGGATRHYSTWYRNAANFCTSATFNLGNGLTLVWSP